MNLREIIGKADTHRTPPPVTLPRIEFCTIDTEQEAREAAERLVERKVIRAGIDAWQSIKKADSFENWKRIGAALSIGKAHALRVTGANCAWGQNYSRVFCDWMKRHHFDRMPKSLRSHAIELHENIAAIEAWRSTLPEKQRQRLAGSLQNVRRWRRETAPSEMKIIDDAERAAAAWRRFVRCARHCRRSKPRTSGRWRWRRWHAEAEAPAGQPMNLSGSRVRYGLVSVKFAER